MNLWVDYKVFSYIMLGPRYNYQVEALMEGLSSRKYYDNVVKIYRIIKEGNLDSILTEYTSCFINDFKHLKCPPYESWYREKTVYGKPAQEVLEYYLKYGIIPERQIPDHISTELEFVSFLFFMNNESEANDFIKNHLLTWVPVFAQNIINNAYGEYTREIGKALLSFIDAEKERLS
ncbi:MAG: molecular chaperone TorD family protein [Candidatus Aramenus sulfurataquae]|uniref:Molecular chaperone TorD family protein n=1 Tax=Candidatus Aramenus sulfurataquae TaxID=1326980 RepID=A0ACC6TRP6_9CREN